jgi:Transposase DDE domain group 1
VVAVDAKLVTAHSDKENAKPTFKKGYGFHPLCVCSDHGSAGTGEPLAILLRPGNAGSNTAADHISVLRQAFTQLPGLRSSRPGKKVLVRVDGCWPLPRADRMADRAAGAILARLDPARRCRRPDREAPRQHVAARLRRRRTPDHGVHHHRTAGRPRVAAPPTRPPRGPDPQKHPPGATDSASTGTSSGKLSHAPCRIKPTRRPQPASTTRTRPDDRSRLKQAKAWVTTSHDPPSRIMTRPCGIGELRQRFAL